MNLLKLFQKRTHYPPQQIPDRILDLINQMDTKLVDQSTVNDHPLELVEISIPLHQQFYSNDKLFKMIKLPIGYYLPRSIAFYINASGDWKFIIGIRTPNGISNMTTADMFIELLTRTNNSRTLAAKASS